MHLLIHQLTRVNEGMLQPLHCLTEACDTHTPANYTHSVDVKSFYCGKQTETYIQYTSHCSGAVT